jgi:hypothetical protein
MRKLEIRDQAHGIQFVRVRVTIVSMGKEIIRERVPSYTTGVRRCRNFCLGSTAASCRSPSVAVL